MVLVLRSRDIKGLMPFSAYVGAVERGYAELGARRALNIHRQSISLAGEEVALTTADGSGGASAFRFKAAAVQGLGAVLSAYTEGLSGGLQTYTMLFDPRTGALAAVIEALYYDWMKTGAVGALATMYLAPQNSSVLSLFGTGRHARMQLRAACAARPITRVQVYSRDPDRRKTFAGEMAKVMSVDVVPARTARDALRNADVVTTITTATAPVFDADDLDDRPIHINAMGAHHPAREVDDWVVRKSRIFVDDRQQALREKGELVAGIARGLLRPEDVAGDLSDLVVGRVRGRDAATRWTLFLSGGTSVEDAAVAATLLAAACERGAGLGVDLTPGDFAWTVEAGEWDWRGDV